MISFKWRHFKRDIILMLVRWYLGYSLSYRDIEALALERGLMVDHATINRWVSRSWKRYFADVTSALLVFHGAWMRPTLK